MRSMELLEKGDVDCGGEGVGWGAQMR